MALRSSSAGGAARVSAVLRQHMTHMRLRPASLWVAGAIGTEIGGGLLLAAGLLSPLGSVGVGAAMLMAIALVHWGKGFFAPGRRVEYLCST